MENPAMRKKQKTQSETRNDQLLNQYDGIGIKAVAAAVEPGRQEFSDEERCRREEHNANKDE